MPFPLRPPLLAIGIFHILLFARPLLVFFKHLIKYFLFAGKQFFPVLIIIKKKLIYISVPFYDLH